MKDKFTQVLESRHAKERQDALMSMYGGLYDAISLSGGELYGISLKFNAVECLMTLRGQFSSGPMVSFVGSEDIAGCFCKAMREASGERLHWRDDHFVGNS